MHSITLSIVHAELAKILEFFEFFSNGAILMWQKITKC